MSTNDDERQFAERVAAVNPLLAPDPGGRSQRQRLAEKASARSAPSFIELPPIHKDPFDRILIAQAKVESMTIVTRDEDIPGYGVPVLRA